MKIGNHTNHSNPKTFQKKEKSKQAGEKQTASNTPADSLNLSSGILLLSQLLDAPEHQYAPLPFYFFEAAAKNALTVASIAKSIQQKAALQDFSLNYNMILELTLSHSNEVKNKTPNYQHISLQKNESIFFETFHGKCQEQQITTITIAAVVVEYFQHLQNRKIHISNQQEQTYELRQSINKSDNPDISDKREILLGLLVVASG